MDGIVQYYNFNASVPSAEHATTPNAVPLTDENTPATVSKLHGLWDTHQNERATDLGSLSEEEEGKELGEQVGDPSTNWASFQWWLNQCPADGRAFPAQTGTPACDTTTGNGCGNYHIPAGCGAMSFTQAMDLAFGAEWESTFRDYLNSLLSPTCGANTVTTVGAVNEFSPSADGKLYEFGVVADAWGSAGISEADRSAFSYFNVEMAEPSGAPAEKRTLKSAIQM